MPTTKSAKKRLRQDVKRTERNRADRTEIRNIVRSVRKLISEGDVDQSQERLRLVYKKLDQAAASNLVHRNAAARTKSRLSAAIRNLKTSKSAG